MISLSKLFNGIDCEVIKGALIVSVDDISFDTRTCKGDDIFVCLNSIGDGLDGHTFAKEAYQKGVRVFLTEKNVEALDELNDITLIKASDTRKALAIMSINYFDNPAKKIKIIALGGTKGKTTISFFLKSIFEQGGKRVGIIGSNGIYYDGQKQVKLLNTTPDSYVLNKHLAEMVKCNTEYCFIETTSQGFMLNRTYGIHFDLALYTNISPDHISKTEHKDFDEYFNYKSMIFNQTDTVIVNKDAELFERIVAGKKNRIITYGIETGDYKTDEYHLNISSGKLTTEFSATVSGEQIKISLNMAGYFNISNALGAVVIADYFKIPPHDIKIGLEKSKVSGRMEIVDTSNSDAPLIIIDFAHNKISIENLIKTVKMYNPKRILSVFGLEGNRAHIRRFDCGKVLGAEIDYTILANASPRTDDENQILKDIATGIEEGGGNGKYEIINDRRLAIIKMLKMANNDDIVLLVGKGDVPYEEVNGEKIPFNERDVIKEFYEGAK